MCVCVCVCGRGGGKERGAVFRNGGFSWVSSNLLLYHLYIKLMRQSREMGMNLSSGTHARPFSNATCLALWLKFPLGLPLT